MSLPPLDLALMTETAEDDAAIERLHARVFGPGRFARTAFRLREAAGHKSRFAFVARVGSLLVGSVRVTAITIGGEAALMLGPLAVDPAFERRGIGRALIAKAAEAAKAAEYPAMLLVGDNAYYGPLGFSPVPMGQITLPGPVDPARLLALVLKDGALKTLRGAVMAG